MSVASDVPLSLAPLAMPSEGEPVDAAILDLNLGGEKAYPIAEALEARGVPFLFTTGYDAADMPPAWRHVPRLEKPVDVAVVVRALRSAGEGPS